MITDSPPKDAIRVEYQANRRTGVYYTWRRGPYFYWSSLGNGGVEFTQVDAEDKAKRWIREGK